MELFINNDFARNRAEVYVVERIGETDRYYIYNGTEFYTKEIELTGIAKNPDIKPLFIAPLRLIPALLKLFADEANKQGIKTSDEAVLQGTLNATKEHLMDMRDIVKHTLKMNK